MFGRRNPETSTEAPKPVETIRESLPEKKDRYADLAKQRVDSFTKTKGSVWARLKQGFNTARDFVLTIDVRTADTAGQIKDNAVEGAKYVGGKVVEAGQAVGRAGAAGAEATVEGIRFVQDKAREAGEALEEGIGTGIVATVEGAKYVGAKTVDASKAVGRGAKATAEFGVGAAIVGAEAIGSAGKYVYETGKAGAEQTWEGIQRGVESAQNKYSEVRSGIAEKFRRAKEAVLNRAEMLRYKGEQAKLNTFKALSDSFAQRAGLSAERMAAIQEQARQRLEAKGITKQESEGIAA